MAYNYQEMFAEIDKRLSAEPALRLCQLTRELRCSHPTIEKAVFRSTSLVFREYQKKKLLQKAVSLLQEGHQAKEVGLALGYKWPENFSRFLKKRLGRPTSELGPDQVSFASKRLPGETEDSKFNK